MGSRVVFRFWTTHWEWHRVLVYFWRQWNHPSHEIRERFPWSLIIPVFSWKSPTKIKQSPSLLWARHNTFLQLPRQEFEYWDQGKLSLLLLSDFSEVSMMCYESRYETFFGPVIKQCKIASACDDNINDRFNVRFDSNSPKRSMFLRFPEISELSDSKSSGG